MKLKCQAPCVPLCEKYVHIKGLCSGHYQRSLNGKDITTPLRFRSPNGIRKKSRPKKVSTANRLPLDVTPITPMKDQLVAIDKLSKVPARLCGDSMGVGKTVTGIGLDFRMREERPDLKDRATLIVSEKIGLDVWDYHLQAMGVPVTEILVIDPTNRDEFVDVLKVLGDQRRGKSRLWKHPQFKYFIIHWDALRLVPELTARRGQSGTGQPKIEFAHIICDEIHLMKNRMAIRTIETKRISCLYKTGLSGTPADDKPQDLWSILHWLYPKKYRSYWRFIKKYVDVEITDGGYRKLGDPINVDELHRELRPFYIRRTLLEIQPDMPEKIHVRPITMVKMGARQRKEYESMRDKALALIGDKDFTLLAPAHIAVLTRLQQMAMATLSPEWDIPDVPEEDQYYTGAEDDPEWDEPNIVLSKPSPKLDAVMNIIKTHEEEPFVIFTQFRGMADLVEEECQIAGIPVVKIHGGVTKKETRTRLVKEFQDGKARVFVGTIAAAGKTITLTRASHVIFVDLSWNPSKNNQAEDRLWRRTQKNTVRVIEIQADDSIDQLREQIINSKGQKLRTFLMDKDPIKYGEWE